MKKLFLILILLWVASPSIARTCTDIEKISSEWYLEHIDSLSINVDAIEEQISLDLKIPILIDKKKLEGVFILQESKSEVEIYLPLSMQEEKGFAISNAIFIANIETVRLYIKYAGCNNYFYIKLKTFRAK